MKGANLQCLCFSCKDFVNTEILVNPEIRYPGLEQETS